MASLLSGTTIGGHVAVHANNISTYALTSVPSNVITTSGGTLVGNLSFADVADNIRFQKGSNHLNLKDPWSNFHLYIPSGGIYSDATAYYFRNTSSTVWLSIESGNVQASSSLRAPIFYDSDDLGYYLNPNSNSRLNIVRAYRFENNDSVSSDSTFGLYFGNGDGNPYAIYREPGAWTYPYPDLRIAFHTGIKIGANASYEGVRFYTDYDMSSQVMSVNNGSDPLGGGNVYVNNSLQAGSSLRAPIFYDSNDTTYYLDPNASTSLKIAGLIETTRSSGTMLSHGSMADAIGWNGDYGTYIGSTVGGTSYLYANGTFYTGGAFRTLIHSGNIGSQSVNYASSAGNADTVDSLHASDFVRAYTTTSDNIDANWGQSFKTFDPVPSGTPPIASPNLRTINVGEDYNRRTQMAFTYSEDRAWFRRRTEAGWGSWREFIHSGNIASQSVSYADESGYSASSGSVEWTSVQNKPSFLSTSDDSEQSIGLRYASWNDGARRMNTDPRWNESGYDADLGCLHIWAWTAAGVAYGRAGIALYNGGAYQYLTTRSGTTGLFVNNNEIIHGGNIGSQSVNYASSAGNADTVDGYHMNQALLTTSSPTFQEVYANGWFRTTGYQGLYNPTNAAHFYPNNASYGSWRIDGTRNGWAGLHFESGATLMMNSNETGVHREGYGWQFRWENGTMYCHKNSNGGGTSATVLDTSNFTNWAQPASTAINTGNIGSQIVQGLGTAFLGNGTSNIGDGYSRVIRNENGLGGNPNYAPILHLAASDTMWQIAGPHAGQTGLVWRSGYAGTWNTPWWNIMHSGLSSYEYANNMNQYVRTTDNVTFNTTTAPTILVNNHSDNTRGYRIHNTSGSSVSAMFTNSSNQLVIAAGAVDQINLNKKVYVNGVALGVNVAPSATAGRIDASNDIVAYSSSDERLKQNITPIENAIDKVKSLTGVEFDWKPEYKHAHGYEGHDTGIIAQQVQDVIPSAVRTNNTGFLAVRYEKLIGLLIEANKELAARVEELEKKLG